MTRTSAGGAQAERGPARFLPGAVIGGRYRIVGPIGRGGMGEVYRADDLKLGQVVALKFLPPGLEKDASRRERLLNEVRVALRVSHPNVCRVHDLGETDGHHYLSMEYVDGEDLASLLRRIGRLPQDKAVQAARQLCAGLAAAHEQGILHRDLKPSNVMLDGRGRIKITDFGLAGMSEAIREDDVAAGTPAYMAPEQLSGSAVTKQSDIYALGLVLYEVFTGRPAFTGRSPDELARARMASTPASPASHVDGLDPLVERVVLRCLESDPRRRPQSALAVAAALPGGDPLAEALAAGETPSPEMVAAGGGSETGLRPAVAFACVAVLVVSVVLQLFLAGRFPETAGLLGFVTPEAPEVLAREAGKIAASLGYTDRPLSRAFGFNQDSEYVRWLEKNDPSPTRWNRLAAPRSSAFHFWYRQSPRHLEPELRSNVRVWARDPRPYYSGELLMRLDHGGRLMSLEVVPPETVDPLDSIPETDWGPLFAASGLDRADFTSTPPRLSPTWFADRREAWERKEPNRAELPARIEGASFRGRAVSWTLVEPWTRPGRMVEAEPDPGYVFFIGFFLAALVAIVTGAIVLARRNLRLGRGDRRGAFKVALLVAIVGWIQQWVLRADHALDLDFEVNLILKVLPDVAFLGFMSWLTYLAVEPFVRSRWPDALISWNRLLEGRFLDARIGRDLVLGAAAAGVTTLLSRGQVPAARALGIVPALIDFTFQSVDTTRSFLAAVLGLIVWPLVITLMFLFLLLLIQMLVRKRWLAVVTVVLLLATLEAIESRFPFWLSFAVATAGWGLLLALLARFGLLCAVAFILSSDLLGKIPSGNLSVWYSSSTVVLLLIAGAMAGFGLYTSIRGRATAPQGVDR